MKLLSAYTPKLRHAFAYAGSYAKWNLLGMFKTWFTVLTLLVFSYAMIYAENFQAYDRLVLANWSGLDEQKIQNDDVFAIDLESIVVDESDDLGARKITYTVRPWDTPGQIARQFGVTTKNLKAVNEIEWDKLKPGQKLIITPVEWFVVENSLGDVTIAQYASHFGLDLSDLKELNDYVSDQDIVKKWYDMFISLTEEEGIRIGMIEPEIKPVETYKPSTKDPKNPQKNTTIAAKKPAAKVITNTTIANSKSVKKVWKAFYSAKLTASKYGFYRGQCTAYVANVRPEVAKVIRLQWWWDAKNRFNRASKWWLSVWKKAAIGAVWVLWTKYGRYGHVWVVASVSDSEVCMNNANVRGLWVVSQDCFPKSAFIGFIY